MRIGFRAARIRSSVRHVRKYLNKNFSRSFRERYGWKRLASRGGRPPRVQTARHLMSRDDETNFERQAQSANERGKTCCVVIASRYASFHEGCCSPVDTACHCLNHPLERKETRENSCCVIYRVIFPNPSSAFLAFFPSNDFELSFTLRTSFRDRG